MKNIYFKLLTLVVLQVLWMDANAQSEYISLETAQKVAAEVHPITQQKILYEQQYAVSQESVKREDLPQFSINGQYAYYSDVIAPENPEAIQSGLFPEIPHNQWVASANVEYALYDGGVKNKSLDIEAAEFQKQMLQADAQLFGVKQTVTNIYFQALSYQEQEALILDGAIKELNNRLTELKSLEANGVVLASDVDHLNVELLKAEQSLLSVQAKKKGALHALGVWLNREDTWQTIVLERPQANMDLSLENNRPELDVYAAQNQMLSSQSELMEVKNLPKVSLFGSGGYGAPNPYNFLLVEGDGFYLAGVKLAWAPFDYGVTKRHKQEIQIQQEVVLQEKENFIKQVNAQVVQLEANIVQMQQMIEKDKAIIAIQTKNLNRAKSQFENGVITSSQYATAVNELTEAQLNLSNHELSLLQAEYTLKITLGNL